MFKMTVSLQHVNTEVKNYDEDFYRKAQLTDNQQTAEFRTLLTVGFVVHVDSLLWNAAIKQKILNK